MSFPVSVIKTPSRRWKGARVTRYCNSNNWQRGHRESTENAYKSRRKRKTQWKHELRLEQAPQDKWRNEQEKALGPRWHATRNAPGGWEWRLTKPRTGGRMCRARADSPTAQTREEITARFLRYDNGFFVRQENVLVLRGHILNMFRGKLWYLRLLQ